MQKIVYLSNSRDYTEQGDINENKYFTHVNGLLDDGWKVAHLTPLEIAVDNSEKPAHRETLVAFVLLEKTDEHK
ncbi:MAG: hypothetical protein FWC62_05195 [Firmicutes bacterium]|nr:hypothetical protein [Bacillota bacterium]